MLNGLINQAADLALHAHTALPLALDTPLSVAAAFFESSAFGNYRKSQEGRQKLSLAMLSRFDGLARQLAALGKALVKRR